ncbi:hypothetical protein CVT24_005568, partial [Panaeolus cyanescens]
MAAQLLTLNDVTVRAAVCVHSPLSYVSLAFARNFDPACCPDDVIPFRLRLAPGAFSGVHYFHVLERSFDFDVRLGCLLVRRLLSYFPYLVFANVCGPSLQRLCAVCDFQRCVCVNHDCHDRMLLPSSACVRPITSSLNRLPSALQTINDNHITRDTFAVMTCDTFASISSDTIASMSMPLSTPASFSSSPALSTQTYLPVSSDPSSALALLLTDFSAPLSIHNPFSSSVHGLRDLCLAHGLRLPIDCDLKTYR